MITEKILNKGKLYLNEKEVAQGIVFPQDFLNKKNNEKLNNLFKVGEGIFALSNQEKNNLTLTSHELTLIKPYYQTSNFVKWNTNSKNNYWLIYTDSKFKNLKEIEKYPNIKSHLDQFSEIITSDNKPYGLHRARDERFFKDEKIVVARKCISPEFSYNQGDCYVSATFYIIKSDRIKTKYLLSLLNSNLIKFWLKNKGKMQGNNYQIDKEPILSIPIKQISPEEQKPFIEKADLMLNLNKEFYDKKNKFFNRIKKSFSLEKLNKKIDSFYELEFNDFVKEIEKLSKKKLSLKEQDEWEDYFNEYKKDLLSLKDKIEKTDEEINKMVYKLYGLSKDEIRVIEESLR